MNFKKTVITMLFVLLISTSLVYATEKSIEVEKEMEIDLSTRAYSPCPAGGSHEMDYKGHNGDVYAEPAGNKLINDGYVYQCIHCYLVTISVDDPITDSKLGYYGTKALTVPAYGSYRIKVFTMYTNDNINNGFSEYDGWYWTN